MNKPLTKKILHRHFSKLEKQHLIKKKWIQKSEQKSEQKYFLISTRPTNFTSHQFQTFYLDHFGQDICKMLFALTTSTEKKLFYELTTRTKINTPSPIFISLTPDLNSLWALQRNNFNVPTLEKFTGSHNLPSFLAVKFIVQATLDLAIQQDVQLNVLQKFGSEVQKELSSTHGFLFNVIPAFTEALFSECRNFDENDCIERYEKAVEDFQKKLILNFSPNATGRILKSNAFANKALMLRRMVEVLAISPFYLALGFATAKWLSTSSSKTGGKCDYLELTELIDILVKNKIPSVVEDLLFSIYDNSLVGKKNKENKHTSHWSKLISPLKDAIEERGCASLKGKISESINCGFDYKFYEISQTLADFKNEKILQSTPQTNLFITADIGLKESYNRFAQLQNFGAFSVTAINNGEITSKLNLEPYSEMSIEMKNNICFLFYTRKNCLLNDSTSFQKIEEQLKSVIQNFEIVFRTYKLNKKLSEEVSAEASDLKRMISILLKLLNHYR